MSGTKSPALFTSLELSQQLQSKPWKVNMMRVSLVDGESASESKDDIKTALDEVIDYESAGFEINAEQDSFSISNSNGLGRLDASFMASWNENKTAPVSYTHLTLPTICSV